MYEFLCELQMPQPELKTLTEELLDAKDIAEGINNKKISLLENNPSGFFILSSDGTIHKCNSSGATLLGSKETNLVNLNFRFFVSETTRPLFNHCFKKLFQNRSSSGFEVNLTRSDGSTIFVHIDAFPCKAADICYLFVSNITDQKLAEHSLRISESKYRRLYESLMDGYASTDMTGRITETNEAFCKMLGYDPEELYKLTYKDITPGKWHKLEEKILNEQILTRGYSDVYEKEYSRKDGTVFPVELRSTLVKNETGENIGIWAIVRDMTKHKHAEDEKVYLEMIKGEENERLRIALEIHDHLGHMIISSKLHIEHILSLVKEPGLRRELDHLLEQVIYTYKEMRKVSSKLAGFPFQGNIRQSIKTFLDDFETSSGIIITHRIGDVPDNTPDPIVNNAFRILEESLTNIVKHSNATRVWVQVRIKNEMFFMNIRDNGQGIDDVSILAGVGLNCMKQRAKKVNGNLEIKSVKGKFFVMKFSAPVNHG